MFYVGNVFTARFVALLRISSPGSYTWNSLSASRNKGKVWLVDTFLRFLGKELSSMAQRRGSIRHIIRLLMATQGGKILNSRCVFFFNRHFKKNSLPAKKADNVAGREKKKTER